MARKPTRRSGVQQSLYNLKQILAGAAESTIANTSEEGNYRPAIVDAIPAIGGLIGTLVNQRKDGKAFSGDTAVERYLNDSMRRAALGSQRTNKTLGIEAPANTDELFGRVLGGLAIPSPKASVIGNVISKTAKGKKAVDATKKIVRAVPKPIRKTAKVATEIVTPFRQTKALPAVAIGTGITAALDAVIDGSVDPSTGQRYDGSVREGLGFTDPNSPEAVEEEALTELDNLMMQTAVEAGDVDEVAELDEYMNGDVQEKEVEAIEQDEKLSGYEQAGLAIGAVFAGGVLAKYSRDFLRARSATAVDESTIPAFTGKKYGKSRLGKFDTIRTAVAQQDQPIRSMAEEFLGRNYAKQWGYKADRMTNVSIGSRVRNLFQTGEMPGTASRTIKLAPHAEAYAKELTPDDQRLVSDALNAASALDDYRQTGVLAALTKDREGNAVTPAMLEMLVQQVRSNPKFSKYYDAVQKSYDDLAKYRVLRGRDTQEGYRDLRAKRPNYVAMNRNFEADAPFSKGTQRYSANEDQGLGAARNLEAGAGVQGTSGVGNPFVSLFDEWSNEVRRSDLNDLRADFLINMDAAGGLNSAGKSIIQQVSPNSTGDDIHVVRVGGRQVTFRVIDPQVNKALHMAPRSSIKTLEALRQAQQSMTTGALATVFNLFTAVKTPIYDTTMGLLIRPKGVALGNINEALGTNIPDPTASISAYTGAARYLWDDMKGGIATYLRDNMIRENTWLKGLLGDRNLDNLATTFENAYENSIKADLDRQGISSITMHGSPDASELMTGVEGVAPHFAQATGKAIREDISGALAAGEITRFKAAIANSTSRFAQAKANTIVRTYGNVLEALHNGFRYSAHATNKGRITNLDEHISNMRRLSADSAQHGGSDMLNEALGSFAYANLGVQSLYELGRRAAENPANFLFNIGTTLGGAAALHYAAIGSDPVAAEKHKLKTPQQKATSLTTFGGAELPLDPVMRLFTAGLFPIYDQMSGLNDGNYNPDFFKVMESWLEGETPGVDEEAREDHSVQLWSAVRDNNPFQIGGFPLANVALANFGVDPGMSRMTGETMMERSQNLTGLESDVRRPDSIASAHTENMISAMFSTVGRSLYGIVDDMYRAYGVKGELLPAIEQGKQKWKDQAVKGSGQFKPMLFGNYESIESAADVNFQLMKDREPGLEQAVSILNKDSKTGGLVSANRPRASEFMPQEPGVVPPEVVGTQAGFIAEMASQLERLYLSKNREILTNLGKKAEGYSAQYLTTVESRNKNINEINEERRYQRLMMLTQTKQYEELISERIGRPFTFRDFNPEEYLIPLETEN